jgi:hypothetical protein
MGCKIVPGEFDQGFISPGGDLRRLQPEDLAAASCSAENQKSMVAPQNFDFKFATHPFQKVN